MKKKRDKVPEERKTNNKNNKRETTAVGCVGLREHSKDDEHEEGKLLKQMCMISLT